MWVSMCERDSLHGYVGTIKEGYSANKVHGTLINNLIGHFVLDTIIIKEYGIGL